MQLPSLQSGRLVKRYKRFLADIETDEGVFTAHCPNTGAMTGCAEPGWRVWYSLSDNPKRKYAATWELVETEHGICGVNTGFANKLVGEAIREGVIEDLGEVSTLQSEVPIPSGNGRFDFALGDANASQRTFVEVKSVTLYAGKDRGIFPDAVSSRAKKHVEELQACAAAGHRAVLIFCAQHCGIENVSPANEIDPDYADALRQAVADGVEVRAYGCATDLQQMRIDRRIEFSISR